MYIPPIKRLAFLPEKIMKELKDSLVLLIEHARFFSDRDAVRNSLSCKPTIFTVI